MFGSQSEQKPNSRLRIFYCYCSTLLKEFLIVYLWVKPLVILSFCSISGSWTAEGARCHLKISFFKFKFSISMDQELPSCTHTHICVLVNQPLLQT